METLRQELARIQDAMHTCSQSEDPEGAHGNADDLLGQLVLLLAKHAGVETEVQHIVDDYDNTPTWYA